VVGDVPELDLYLPLAEGASAILVATPETPWYELPYFMGQPRVRIVRRMSSIPRLIVD
jgi:hypothetical protein